MTSQKLNYKAKVLTPLLAAWTRPACFLNTKANFEDYKSKEISKSWAKKNLYIKNELIMRFL